MSVPKSKRTEGKLTAIVKSSQLASHTIKICSNENHFPKRYRWCITNKIVDTTIEINSFMFKANSIYVMSKADYETRLSFQNQALSHISSLLALMDIAFNLFTIDGDSMEHWVGLVVELQNYIRNWKKSDKERYSKFE